jgi:hypothetical protein
MEIRDVTADITENLNSCHRICYVTGKYGCMLVCGFRDTLASKPICTCILLNEGNICLNNVGHGDILFEKQI